MTGLCQETAVRIGCDRSSVLLLEDGYYRARFNHGNPPDIARRFSSHRVSPRDPLVAAMADADAPVTVNDTSSSPLMNQEAARSARIRAIVVAPIPGPGAEPVGFLTAEFNENRGRFDEDDVALVSIVARLVGMVLMATRPSLPASASDLDVEALSGDLGLVLGDLFTVVAGAAEEIARRDDAGAGSVSTIGDLRHAVIRGTALVRDLLALGRRQVLRPRPRSAQDFAAWIETAVRRRLPPGSVFSVQVDTDAPPIHADSLAVVPAVARLVVGIGARLAAPARIRVRIARAEADPQRAAGSRPDRVALRIADDGPPISAEEARRLFAPNVVRSDGGRILDLDAVSAGATLQQTGGRVTIPSPASDDTRLVVELPAAAAIE